MPIAGIAVRGVEALIDLVVCYVLLYSIAAIAGTTIEGGGIYLHNAPLMMGAGLCFAYYVVLEAAWGAILGKLATNTRVVRENDGGPIGWSAAIIRNMLRPIDGLVLYLVGFIAICMSPKRQRIATRSQGQSWCGVWRSRRLTWRQKSLDSLLYGGSTCQSPRGIF